MIRRFLRPLVAHKIATTLAVVAVVSGGYYFYTQQNVKSTAPQYVTAVVERGTLTVSVSGTGQVSSSNQIDVKPLASGKITRISVQEGQDVAENTLLVQLDTNSALRAVRDAEASLKSAKLSLQKLQTPADTLSLLQAENAVVQAAVSLGKLKSSQVDDYQSAIDVKQKAIASLTKSYDDAFN